MTLETFNIKVKAETESAERAVDRLKKKLGATRKEAKSIESAWSELNAAVGSDNYKSIDKKYSKMFGKTWEDLKAGKTTIGEVSKEFEKTSKQTEKASKHTNTFFKRVKALAASVLIWRAISQAIRNVIKGMKEGVENAYLFSKANGGALSKALDKIESKTTALKNAFGAVISNFIVAVEPFITKLIDTIIPILNKASEIIAKMFGFDTYLKANEDIMKQWKQNNDDTRDLIGGIDKLNNIGKSDTPVTDMFKEVATDFSTTWQEDIKQIWTDFQNWWSEKVEPWFVDLWENKILPAIVNVTKSIIAAIVEPDNSFWGQTLKNGGNLLKFASGQMTWEEVMKAAEEYANGNRTMPADPLPGYDGSYDGKNGPYAVAPKTFGEPDVYSPEEWKSKFDLQSYNTPSSDYASASAQMTSAIVSAINRQNLKVVIGDETIGASANRANNDNYKLGGVGYA